MYLSNLKGNRCGGWGITGEATTDEGYSFTDVRECTIAWAVNVPGENQWYLDEMDGIMQIGGSENPYEPPLPHKFPVPGSPHVGVQLKVASPLNSEPQMLNPYIFQIYDNTTQDTLKATDVLTFVGILTSEPYVPFNLLK